MEARAVRGSAFARGLNVCEGQVTYKAVARDLGYSYIPAESLLA
jgi:alanine dehydrogenase